MPIPRLAITEIEDDTIRKNFENIVEFFRQESPLLGFKHFELTLDTNVTDANFQHNLGFTPTDVFITFQSGGNITFNYANFDGTNIVYTASGITDGTPGIVRFFLGSYNSSP